VRLAALALLLVACSPLQRAEQAAIGRVSADLTQAARPVASAAASAAVQGAGAAALPFEADLLEKLRLEEASLAADLEQRIWRLEASGLKRAGAASDELADRVANRVQGVVAAGLDEADAKARGILDAGIGQAEAAATRVVDHSAAVAAAAAGRTADVGARDVGLVVVALGVVALGVDWLWRRAKG
jgi:hypothetical protein